VETYGTQNAIALLTQHMGYGDFFDRADLSIRKKIEDVQYIAAMNPIAGNFTICERAQRHFATFACAMPSQTDQATIFRSLMAGHVMGFSAAIGENVQKIVEASILLYEKVSNEFRPTAVCFTYNWSLRELTNVFQGICQMRGADYSSLNDVVRIWAHEFYRVISDRFFFMSDLQRFDVQMREVLKVKLGINNADEVLRSPLVYTAFADSNNGAYLPVASMDSLRSVVDHKLGEYNESNAIMDLVLFEQAAEHICRIARIISQPGGNAMLIGVGGSGKQSLSKLAAFICDQMEVRQVQITGNFKEEDFKEKVIISLV
jgi:dynein heavy chain